MLLQNLMRGFLAFAGRIGADSADTDEIRLNKTLLTSASLIVSTFGIFWSGIYQVFNEPMAASIPLSYAIFSFISILIFHYTHRYRLFRFSQLLLTLMLPFLLMVALGGFINASAVILWSLLCPLGALMFAGWRQARLWFVAFIILVVISGYLQAFAPTSNNLPPNLISIFFVLNFVGVSFTIFILLYYFINQRDLAFALLRAEQEKSERLLLNVLPSEIAVMLKDQHKTIATYYESASVLFADLVGFTPLSTTMTPTETVELLNEIFSHFDALVAQYGLEKIRTVGDNYMVAAGVPSPRADHCFALARLALDMRDYLVNRPDLDGQHIAFRIGMNAGPLVAGVIGQQKFHYDVWGDTVNTASRMESHGVAQKIQLTDMVYSLLKDDFICEPRGSINIRGKGDMETWFLIGERVTSEY